MLAPTAEISTLSLHDALPIFKQLSPDEIRARGIVVDSRNFDVFEYTFTFIIDGKEVHIPFPVIIDPRTREVRPAARSEEHTSELQSQSNLVCRLLLEKKKVIK